MSQPGKIITINMDNRLLQVEKGLTILRAAEQNGIYIPTLCAHQELTPYGGCRLCLVEIEGMRGLPTACTTPVDEGMVIRTNTALVQKERTEILQLILSEHTSSCLICEEKDECRKFMGTIRKAGVTTGCRYCSNDGGCELQDVVERLGITQIDYPIYYRHLRIEKEDPFYDRDYNLCILCGRCIRMCQEIRTANTLAFKQRGRYVVIGPAYHRTHLEAGCEFCGACVSVCPTGALSEKVSKWEGKAEREETTTCGLCGVGCQIRLQIKGNAIVSCLPANDDRINRGQLCVKGRFCVPELVGNYRRLKKPYRTEKRTKVEMEWEDAIGLASEKLSACSPEEVGILISTNCSNEDLYVAQKFARLALGSHQIDTTARLFYGFGFNAYLNLLKASLPLSDLGQASVILCAGLDSRFGRSVVGVELRKALRRGARLITIHPKEHSLGLLAHRWIRPALGEELELFSELVELTRPGGGKFSGSKNTTKRKTASSADVANMLKQGANPAILVGSEFLQGDRNRQIFEKLLRLAENIGAKILPLPAQSNLVGSLLMGAYPELLPGGLSSVEQKKAGYPRATTWNAWSLVSGKPLKVLYSIGEFPPTFPALADFAIFQNIYPPDPWYEADLILPSAAFTEADGTFINGEGRIQRIRKAVEPPGAALPDWKILCRIAQRMGKNGFDFSSASEIHQEISESVEGFGDFEGEKRTPFPLHLETELNLLPVPAKERWKRTKGYPLLLTTSIIENTYRGFPISAWVEGAKAIFPEGIVAINPEDAETIGIKDGEDMVLTSFDFEKTWPASVTEGQPPGTLHITLAQREYLGPNPHPVKIRKKD